MHFQGYLIKLNNSFIKVLVHRGIKTKKPRQTRLFLQSYFRPMWCGPGSNRRHKDFQSFALPTELPHHYFGVANIGFPFKLQNIILFIQLFYHKIIIHVKTSSYCHIHFFIYNKPHFLIKPYCIILSVYLQIQGVCSLT